MDPRILAEHAGNHYVLQAVLGDMTAERVDAIVNAANSNLAHGGGLAGAIVARGGAVIQEESDKPTVIALREIAEGFVTPEILSREEELEAEEELAEVMDSSEGVALEGIEPLAPPAEPPLGDQPL